MNQLAGAELTNWQSYEEFQRWLIFEYYLCATPPSSRKRGKIRLQRDYTLLEPLRSQQ
jgi:hypothetical protein